jgi:hypothetical protein
MHHFFSVPELVQLLCEEMGDQDDDLSQDDPATSCQDLAALACTATVFQRPALDALWWHQESLINIILCMPADLWESEESVKDQSNFVRSSINALNDTCSMSIRPLRVPLPLRISSAR